MIKHGVIKTIKPVVTEVKPVEVKPAEIKPIKQKEVKMIKHAEVRINDTTRCDNCTNLAVVKINKSYLCEKCANPNKIANEKLKDTKAKLFNQEL